MKKNLNLAIALFFCALLGACSQKPLQFESTQIQFGVETDTAVSIPVRSINISFETPIAGSNTALQQIREQIISAVFGFPTDSIVTDSTLLVALLFDLDSVPAPDSLATNFEYSATGTVIFNNEKILSYEVSSYSYSGGAHGTDWVQYLVFDLKTGNRLAENDVFKGDYETVLTQFFIAQLASEDGFENFEKENIRPNNNFFMDDKGVTYVFNRYEIACGACGGPFKIFIPFSEIQGILK
ncbi:MAG: RsiV family protein [Bacteroidales bacterium]|jgi:hypothetical protein|nr:RsiV family protein [Bacteroidales bacterium]